MLDLLIRNGRLVDGTGSPWYRADIGVRRGVIEIISRVPIPSEAAQIVDAEDMVVAPGFIDIHSHADLAILREPEALGRLRQGVTTQVIGNCGLSVAPVTPDAAALLKTLYEPTLGSCGDWTWSSVAEYLGLVGSRPLGTNIALLLGHATIRAAGMQAIEKRRPTPDELRAMQRMVESGLEAGAFGVSSGLIYPPSCYADTVELTEIARSAARHGGFYASHIRGEGRTLISAIKEVIAIARDAGIPGHISHLKANNPQCWGKVAEVLELLEEARRQGIDVSCDQYPYTAGSGALGTITPPWVQEGGIGAMVERLRDPAARTRIKREFTQEDVPGWDNYTRIAGWDNLVITWVKSEAEGFVGRSIAQIAESDGREPWDVVADLLIQERGAVQMVAFIMSEDDVRTVLRYPGTMVGSDGIESGGKPHPRLYGSFPRILERYVRQHRVITLEDAVRKMSALPATRLGLIDRGVLKQGLQADIVIFDPDTVEERASYTEPYRQPAGIEYVIVNGGLSVAKGQPSGKLSGQILRKAGG